MPEHDGRERCDWITDDLMRRYHDEEWAVPLHDDRRHFEFLVLESAQAGLSWQTVLRKREAYREAYFGFDPIRVARFGDSDLARFLGNSGLIRNRLKLEASIENARRLLDVQKEHGSFDAFLWDFVGGKPLVGARRDVSEIPAKTDLSTRISKELKARGFRFVGPTIIYAHMQAVGLVNDHTVNCFRYAELQ